MCPGRSTDLIQGRCARGCRQVQVFTTLATGGHWGWTAIRAWAPGACRSFLLRTPVVVFCSRRCSIERIESYWS